MTQAQCSPGLGTVPGTQKPLKKLIPIRELDDYGRFGLLSSEIDVLRKYKDSNNLEKTCMFIPENKKIRRLQRLLSGYEHIKLTQRTQVEFPVSTTVDLQPTVSPIQGLPNALLASVGTCTSVHIPTHRHIHYFFKYR